MALTGLASRPRLLVLRALGLGDFLTAVPALRASRRAFPDHEVVLAAPRPLEPLVHLSGSVDTLLDARGLEPLRWTGAPPDVAVNLHGRGPQSHAALAALAPERLVAFGSEETSHEGPEWRPDEHEARRWCRLLEETLGVCADPGDLHLERPRTTARQPGAVLVHPGAAYPARRWPPERFAAVARWAVEHGHRVVVTGGPDEVRLAEQVRVLAGLPRDAVLAGRTDLAGLAAEVGTARLVVCGDTGVAHLASAYRTRSVLLFGPTSPARWGPPSDGPHRVLWHGDGMGDPWGQQADPALLRIGVDEVVAAAQQAIGLSATSEQTPARTTPSSA